VTPMSTPVMASLTIQVRRRAFTERPRDVTAASTDGFSLI
jgi:hypothetical protein